MLCVGYIIMHKSITVKGRVEECSYSVDRPYNLRRSQQVAQYKIKKEWQHTLQVSVLSKECDIEIGKDGSEIRTIRKNRSEDEEGVEKIGLEHQRTGDVETRQTDLPKMVREAD